MPKEIYFSEIESHLFDDSADLSVRRQFLVDLIENIGIGEDKTEVIFPDGFPTVEEIRRDPAPLVEELLKKFSWNILLDNINAWRAKKGTGRGRKPWQVFKKAKHFLDKIGAWRGYNHRGEEVEIPLLNVESARMLRDLVRESRGY